MKNHLIIFQKILDGNLSCHFHWPNESTALMRVLVDKKSKNAKSTGLQNVPNESTG